MMAILNILILEDNSSDADLLCRELEKSGLSFVANVVQTKTEFVDALVNFNPDLILSDYSLPYFDAVTAFRIKQVDHSHIPFIIVSGVIGEENAVELIKDGVTDYVSKQRLVTLITKINRALNDSEERKNKIAVAEKLRIQAVELLALNQELEVRVIKRTKALADSENRFRSILETIPQIAWTNTIEGEVIFYNQRWYDYTGLKDFKEFIAAIHREDRKKCFFEYLDILKTTNGGEFQIRGKRADGTYRWHLIRLVPILDENSKIQLWVGTATDIQELRLLQQQKDDFISIASHELKTPITSLKASLQLLDRIKDRPPTDTLPLLITQANKSLNKVTILIEDLLNASMANKGHLHINQKIFNMYQMIKECCNDVHLDDSYTFKIEGNEEVEVFADSIRIEQIVINFINNAIKYAPKSTEILIKIHKTVNEVKVSVIDKGPGIPLDKMEHLFNRYYRVDNSGSKYTGLGLGLYICSEIIKKHGGKIGVDSELGNGSAFWFILPMAS